MARRFPEEMEGRVDKGFVEESREKAKAALKVGNNGGGHAANPGWTPPQQKMNKIITDLIGKGFWRVLRTVAFSGGDCQPGTLCP
jgi:hypothetical protein